MSDRVRPSQEFEASVLDKLKDSGIFETKQKGMMFAAAVGFWLRKRSVSGVDLGRPGEGIRLEYFQKVRDDGFIDALAVAAADDLAVLSDERQDERLELFEKYAQVGLGELKKRVIDVPMEPLDAMLALLEDLRASRSSSEDILPGLSDLI